MTGFTTEPIELQVTGAQLAELVADVRSAAAGLCADADELLGGAWRGGAAAGFGAGWREWLAGYRGVLAALASFAEETSATGRAYTAADEQGRAVLLAAVS